jgi:PAS domain S-box-containing protein
MTVEPPPHAYHSNPLFFDRGNLTLQIWGLTTIALLIIGGSLAWTSYDEYGKTLEQEYRFLETHARFGDAQVAGSLRSIDLLLQDVIDDKLIAPDLRADVVQRHQLEKLRQFPEIHYLITTDNKGQVATAESPEDPMGVIDVRKFNASQRDYFTVHRDAKPEDYYRYQLSRPFKTITNRNTITVSRAIRGKNGQFQGVVLVSLSPAYFDLVLQQVLENNVADAAALHNRFGDIIYRKPDPDKYVGKNIAGGDAFKLYLRSDQHFTRYLGVTATDSVKRILVFSKVGDTNLDVGVSARFDVVMAGWRSNLLVKGLFFVVVAGLSLALALVSQRRLLERRRSEAALHESGARFRTMFEMIPDAIVLHRDGKLLFVNPAAVAMFGAKTEQELMDKPILELIHPDFHRIVLERIKAGTEQGVAAPRIEERYVKFDGTVFDVEVQAQPIVLRGAPAVLATLCDITERKQAEAALAEIAAKAKCFSDALDNIASSYVYMKDSSHQYFYANKATLKLFKCSAEELLGSGDEQFFPPDTVARLKSVDDRVLEIGESTMEEIDVSPDSQERHVYLEVKTPIIDDAGKIIGLCGVSTDITERKQAEEELAQHRDHLEELVAARTSELEQSRDAAEAGNRAKTIFLANMSHELRTPMNGVMGMIDLVLMRATDPKQIDMLNKSKGAAQRMINVINDILDFSKADAERLPLEEKNFSLSQMIDDVVAMQDLTAEAKGLTLIREIPVTFPDQLSGDAFRLRQILLNFLGNACKFSDQGMITVRVSAVEQDGESVLTRIEVEDQGIGINPEQQAMLFQAFTQVDGSMTRKYGGSGLGLIISKRLANLMGGDVGVVSQEGHGSTFWATVRLKPAKAGEVGI